MTGGERSFVNETIQKEVEDFTDDVEIHGIVLLLPKMDKPNIEIKDGEKKQQWLHAIPVVN